MNKLRVLILILFFSFTIQHLTFKITKCQTEAIGITDSSTVTTTYNGNKIGRFMQSGITNIYLQRQSDSHKDYATEIGSTGFYEFDSVYIYPGIYDLYVNGSQKTEYGSIKFAKFLSLTGEDAMEDSLDLGGWRIYNLADPVHGDNAVTLTYLQTNYDPNTKTDTAYLHTTGTDYVYGNVSLSGTVVFSGSGAPTCVRDPSTAADLTRKDYVDSSVASITITPFQEASNHVRLISNGSEQNGIIYNNFAGAIDYFSTASGSNPCWIELVGVGTEISLSHNDLENYVNVYSNNTSLGIVLGVTGAATTKTMTFKGCKIFMGDQGGITTARTYNSFTFIDCEIFAYNDVTFTNCNMTGVIIYNESGEGVTYDGSTRIINCNFNQLSTEGGSFTGIISGMLDGFDATYSMPSDPTAP